MEPRDNFYIICLSEKYEIFWIFPSKLFYEKSSKSKENKIFDLNLFQKNFQDDIEIKRCENNLEFFNNSDDK